MTYPATYGRVEVEPPAHHLTDVLSKLRTSDCENVISTNPYIPTQDDLDNAVRTATEFDTVITDFIALQIANRLDLPMDPDDRTVLQNRIKAAELVVAASATHSPPANAQLDLDTYLAYDKWLNDYATSLVTTEPDDREADAARNDENN